MKSNAWSSGLSVSADGTGVVSHVGSVALRLLADRVGLTQVLSGAAARRGFAPGHDRGRVLVDLAVTLADGGEAIADIDVLRHQGEVFGPVASAPTVWRTLDELTPARLRRIEVGRARVRRHVWSLFKVLPPSRVADRDLGATVVLDVDATLVTAHSEKESARPTFKGGFGFHPIGVWCDNTTELLAIELRPGNAGANTAADHIAVLDAAIRQVPAAHRGNMLVRADGAGCTHDLLDWLVANNEIRGRHVEFSVGFALTEAVRAAITRLPARAWTPAIDAEGDLREGGDVADLTGLLDLTRYPPGTRVIVRREHPHPGAQLSLFEEGDGWRYQPFATNTPTGQLAHLEARHRATPELKTASGTRKTPALPGCHHETSRSTPRGAPRSHSPPTSWPGYDYSPCTGRWPPPNPKRCATGCSTSPPDSSTAPDADGYASRTPGPGPTHSPPRSPASRPSPHPADLHRTCPPALPTRRPETTSTRQSEHPPALTSPIPHSQPHRQGKPQPHQDRERSGLEVDLAATASSSGVSVREGQREPPYGT